MRPDALIHPILAFLAIKFLSEKIEGLKEFSGIFGAEPYLGAKFKNKKWRFVHINDLIKTRGDNYKVDVDLAFSKGLEFDELIRKDKQVKFP